MLIAPWSPLFADLHGNQIFGGFKKYLFMEFFLFSKTPLESCRNGFLYHVPRSSDMQRKDIREGVLPVSIQRTRLMCEWENRYGRDRPVPSLWHCCGRRRCPLWCAYGFHSDIMNANSSGTFLWSPCRMTVVEAGPKTMQPYFRYSILGFLEKV